MSKNNDKYYLAFSYLFSVNPYFKAKLLEFFDYDIEHAFKCNKEELKEAIFPVSRNFFHEREKINPDDILKNIENEKVKYVTYEDEKYPNLLKQIENPPLLMYYKGDFSRCYFDKTLAIVGSRNASQSAKVALSSIISSMKNLPLTIVSGLAMGIDGTAHRCAIQNNIPTIGVIGCGIDIVYPTINKDLYKKMEEENGLILSEYPPKTAGLPRNFPERNRIVTGLSYGTLVAEAALRSGALISANLTLEQGRDVMCLPGVITNPNTEGIYKLIKDGAPIVTSASDVFEILNWDFYSSKNKIELDPLEKNIFDIISREPVSFEKIQMETEIEPSSLMYTLSEMEIKGIIKQISGQYLLG